jgi:hypothetical protein
MTSTAALGLAALILVAALLGVALFVRSQSRRLREDSGRAGEVLDLIPDEPPGPALDLDDEPISLNSRPAKRLPSRGAVDLPSISRLVRQEAAIYLDHHRLALKHHAAYQQASLWAGLLGFTVIVVGALLTYFEGLEVGVVTAVAGAIPSAAGALLYQQANIIGARAAENLRSLEDSVQRFSSLQGALAAFAEISDRETRDDLYKLLGLQLLFPGERLEELVKRTGKRGDRKA